MADDVLVVEDDPEINELVGAYAQLAGFEYRRAEMGNSVRWQATAGERLAMAHENTYAQLAPIDWSSDGTTG